MGVDATVEGNAALQCLIALREARSQLIDDVVTHARNHAAASQTDLTQEDIDILCTGGAFEVAEFYYLVDRYNLNDKRNIRAFILHHNADVEECLTNKDKRMSLGLSVQRLKESLFSETQIERVVQSVAEGKLRLSQTDLACLLYQIMSAEKTRRAVLALAKAGLLIRINIGMVLIVSDGTLEKYFERHLRFIVTHLQGSLLSKEGEHQ
ncbi:hypothetical protein ABIF64_001736 [Bradyrhizobium japonicum]|uniref:hypothetical protein n=1 Tax=Bradyrhizobium japonicum TaxID=375 RepID=UPI001BA7BA61|nr:hypothetical protein [Bradyrhizobium japonicum]MBR0731684.1 hypothetical protein [Bradyrhizobium japonicum]